MLLLEDTTCATRAKVYVLSLLKTAVNLYETEGENEAGSWKVSCQGKKILFFYFRQASLNTHTMSRLAGYQKALRA